MDADLMKQFTDSLPFQLTDSQKKCAYAVLKDLEKEIDITKQPAQILKKVPLLTIFTDYNPVSGSFE